MFVTLSGTIVIIQTFKSKTLKNVTSEPKKDQVQYCSASQDIILHENNCEAYIHHLFHVMICINPIICMLL